MVYYFRNFSFNLLNCFKLRYGSEPNVLEYLILITIYLKVYLMNDNEESNGKTGSLVYVLNHIFNLIYQLYKGCYYC